MTNSKSKTPEQEVRIPVSNINRYIRVPGKEPYPLAQALQQWPNVDLVEYQEHTQERGSEETRTVREVVFHTPEGDFGIPVTEKVYEVGLYHRAARLLDLASVRLTEWMKEHPEEVKGA